MLKARQVLDAMAWTEAASFNAARCFALQQWGAAAAPSSRTLAVPCKPVVSEGSECIIRERQRGNVLVSATDRSNGTSSARQVYGSLLVADDGVELDDGLLLLRREGPALDVRPEVVGPPQPAALAAPVQPWTRSIPEQNKHH